MDPNETLRQIRAIQQEWMGYDAATAKREAWSVAERLAELTGALDEWMTRGGFLPTAWAR